jgi:hypothetical protein
MIVSAKSGRYAAIISRTVVAGCPGGNILDHHHQLFGD